MTKEAPEINVSVTFRHTESTPALTDYALEKVTHCVSKYVASSTTVHVVLSVEKRDHVAEVNVHSKGHDASCKASTGDLYSAIDKVVDNLEALLRKQKEKLLTLKHQGAAPQQ